MTARYKPISLSNFVTAIKEVRENTGLQHICLDICKYRCDSISCLQTKIDNGFICPPLKKVLFSDPQLQKLYELEAACLDVIAGCTSTPEQTYLPEELLNIYKILAIPGEKGVAIWSKGCLDDNITRYLDYISGQVVDHPNSILGIPILFYVDKVGLQDVSQSTPEMCSLLRKTVAREGWGYNNHREPVELVRLFQSTLLKLCAFNIDIDINFLDYDILLVTPSTANNLEQQLHTKTEEVLLFKDVVAYITNTAGKVVYSTGGVHFSFPSFFKGAIHYTILDRFSALDLIRPGPTGPSILLTRELFNSHSSAKEVYFVLVSKTPAAGNKTYLITSARTGE